MTSPRQLPESKEITLFEALHWVCRDTLPCTDLEVSIEEHPGLDEELLAAAGKLFEAAAAGKIKLRAKSAPTDVLPTPLDSAFFRNPIEFSLLSGDITRKFDFYAVFDEQEYDRFDRFEPLVETAGLRRVFTGSSMLLGKLTKEARIWCRGQDQEPAAIWLKKSLIEHLASNFPESSARQRLAAAKNIGELNPGRFRPGRHPKK